MSGAHPELPRRDPHGSSGHLYHWCSHCDSRLQRKVRRQKYSPVTEAEKQAQRDEYAFDMR